MRVTHLTDYDMRLIAYCINKIGIGEHPEAVGTKEGLSFFEAEYATKCLRDALSNDRIARVTKRNITYLLDNNYVED